MGWKPPSSSFAEYSAVARGNCRRTFSFRPRLNDFLPVAVAACRHAYLLGPFHADLAIAREQPNTIAGLRRQIHNNGPARRAFSALCKSHSVPTTIFIHAPQTCIFEKD
jgi:hypothetical protein